jgi:bifunctional non-homologous end joining protein LigD
MRNRSLLDRKATLARLLRNIEAGILFNEHLAEDGPIVFAHACRLGGEGIASKRVDGTRGGCTARAAVQRWRERKREREAAQPCLSLIAPVGAHQPAGLAFFKPLQIARAFLATSRPVRTLPKREGTDQLTLH